VSAEATFPNTQKPVEPDDETAIQVWQNAGYTPALYFGAWQQVFDFYASEFPNQYVVWSSGPGVLIDAQGNYDQKQASINRKTVIREGSDTLTDFSGQFTYEDNSLRGTQAKEKWSSPCDLGLTARAKKPPFTWVTSQGW
jgi:hypothetical protein